MAEFGFIVAGDRKVIERFDNFPLELRQKLLQRITALTDDLDARVLFLVPRKSEVGGIASTIKEAVFDDTDSEKKISGRVAPESDFAKAASLEYGVHSTFTVASHEMKLDHIFAERLHAPIDVFVAAHERTVDEAAHSFLRAALEQMRPEVEAALAEVVAEQTAKENF